MATLYKDPKSGRYYANEVGLDGQRKRKSLKTTDPKEAEALLANIVRQTSHARILGVENVKEAAAVTFKTFVETIYLPSCRANLKAGTYGNYLDYGTKTVAVFGEKYLRAIGADEIGRYLDELRTGSYKRGKTPIPYAVATVNRYKNFLSGVFSHALDNDYIPKHPMKGKKRFQNRRENNLRVRSLTTFEEGRLIEFAPAWFAPMIRLALATGMRRGEIIKLAWADVDRDNRKAWLRDPKSGEDQSVPLNRTAFAVLDGLDAMVVSGRAIPLVFPNASTGEAITKDEIDYAMRSTVEKAGLTDLHFHDLRHTAGTRAYRATKDIKAVQKLLRHSSLTVTLRYVHDAPDDLQAAVDALESPDLSHATVAKNSICRNVAKPVRDTSKCGKTGQNVRETSESVALAVGQ